MQDSASISTATPPTSLTFQEREADQDELHQLEQQTEQLQQQVEELPPSQRRLGYSSAAAEPASPAANDISAPTLQSTPAIQTIPAEIPAVQTIQVPAQPTRQWQPSQPSPAQQARQSQQPGPQMQAQPQQQQQQQPQQVATKSEPAHEESPLCGENQLNVIMVGIECAPWSKTGAPYHR